MGTGMIVEPVRCRTDAQGMQAEHAWMKPFTFSEYCTEWLAAFRVMFPGGARSPLKEPTPREAQAAANQEWECEGGSIKPDDNTSSPRH
jgi:hypothetical protein